MKHQSSQRKRFHKPWHIMEQLWENPYDALMDLFLNFPPDNIIAELNRWEKLAFAVSGSIYEDPEEREDIQEFLQDLSGLLNHYFQAQSGGLNSIEESVSHPLVKTFTSKYSETYTQLALLDLMDAVLNYDGPLESPVKNLIVYYQQIICLFRLPTRPVPPDRWHRSGGVV